MQFTVLSVYLDWNQLILFVEWAFFKKMNETLGINMLYIEQCV